MGKKIKNNLTAKQERFCQLFANPDSGYFGNGTQSYLEAFKEKGKSITYKTARVEAHKQLTKPNVTKRIRELMDIYISSEIVDKELAGVILQWADLSSKVAAIREYNKVKGRVTDKLEGEIKIKWQ